MTPRLLRRALAILATAGWLLFGYLTITTLVAGATEADVFQVDWHVYWAGAHDLLDRDLYRVPLEAGGATLSTPDYNLPPLSAVVAIPLLGLPISVGGYVWQVIAAASVAATAIAAFGIARCPRPWLQAGLVAGPLALTLLYVEGLHLGTNNYLVLAVVAAFAWLYLRGADVPAGVLLGIAIGLKLWPAVLMVVALRDNRFRVVAWAMGVALLQAILLFGWLGLDAVPAFAENLRTEIPATGFLLGPTAVPQLRDVWNDGVGLVAGLVILALPLRRAAGIGATILAGLCAIPNLWIHYGPTVLFAVGLLGWALASRRDEPDNDADQGGDQEGVADDEHADG